MELDLALRCGQLLAAGAGVLQGSHFSRVAERRDKGRCEVEKDEGEKEGWQQGNWEKLNSVKKNSDLRLQIYRSFESHQ